MSALTLPPFQAKINIDQNGQKYIFDPLRLKWIRLTPEEWVRQHFTNYLIEHKHYPKALLAHEVNLKIGQANRRCDILLYKRAGLEPHLIVECKAPSVEITQATFQQICAYNTILRAAYTIVTNGIVHYACRINLNTHAVEYLPSIPNYEDLSS
jgi:hypothetical protein